MPRPAGTIPRMGKKQPEPAPEKQPAPNRADAGSLYVQMNQALRDALDAYIASLRPKPSMKAVIVQWIEDQLREAGFWPPPEDAEPQE